MPDKTVSPKDHAQLRKDHEALLARYEVFVKDLNGALVNAKNYIDRVEGRVASLERKYEDLLKVVAKRIAA